MRFCDSWNAGKWRSDYRSVRMLPEENRRGEWRRLLRDVYRATVEAAESGFYILPDGRRVDIPVSEGIRSGTRFYSEEIFPEPAARFGRAAVEVLEEDCLAVARRLAEAGARPAVLNMASASNPGGGVQSGSGAQEEYLFRCSNYYMSLYQYADFGGMYGVERNPDAGYPLDPRFGGVFSRGVTVFRGLQEDGYPFLEKPWQVDFIAVAAVNRPETKQLPGGEVRLSGRFEAVTRDKIRTVFNIALDNGVDTLVLGAMGCGAFRNPPEHIALLFREVLQEERFRDAFRKVVFAIKTGHSSRRGSSGKPLPQVFRDVFAEQSASGRYGGITRFIEIFDGMKPGSMEGGGSGPDGVRTFPHAVYDESILDFIKVFYDITERHPEFEVTRYLELKEEALKHGEPLEQWDAWCAGLDLGQLFQALAIFIRGDRFCDGFILYGLESGMIRKVLEHIRKLDEGPCPEADEHCSSREACASTGCGHCLVRGGEVQAVSRSKEVRDMDMEGMISRARGCLFGQIAGDSLGGLVEFSDAAAISRRFPPAGPRLLQNGGYWGILAGQPTDDSEMALALARSIVRNGGFSRDRAREAYLEWVESHPFDMGITTRNALHGIPSRGSEANGAMMRISPLAIYGAGMDWHDLWRMADEDASLTHINMSCRNATCMFAILAADAVRTGDAPDILFGRMMERALEMKADSEIIRLAEVSRSTLPGDFMHSMGWVRIAFGNALWHLMNTGSTEEAVCATVASGGDTDTNAAICGALMGAVHGEESVPLQWRQSILECRPGRENLLTSEPRPETYWPCDARDLAEKLLMAGIPA